jgi:hypothetical protein
MIWRRAEESNLHPCGALVFETSKRCRRLAPSVGALPRNRTAFHRVAAGALAIGLQCMALRDGFEPPVTALETVSLTIGNRSILVAEERVELSCPKALVSKTSVSSNSTTRPN